MDNQFDDIFEQQKRVPKTEPAPPPFDPEAYKAQKQKERSDTFQMLNDAADRLRVDGEMLKTYLDLQARFPRYSVNNLILIAAQRPDATKLAAFDVWQKDGVHINKGEKGLSILEPSGTYEREDGTKATNYAIKKVFDIAQTNAEPEPQPAVTRDERTLLKALISDAPCDFQVSDQVPENFNALYRHEQKTILVRRGQDAPTNFRAISQELVQAYLDRGDYSRANYALTANFASYVLCRRCGVPTDPYRFDKTPERYAQMSAKEFREELGRIHDVANTISAKMNPVLESRQQEQRPPDRDSR